MGVYWVQLLTPMSILNLDMPNCMHCQSIVCQNSIARILYAKIPLLEFHMPIVLYAEIPIAKIQESRFAHWVKAKELTEGNLSDFE